MSADCIFCKIASREAEAEVISDGTKVIAFKDRDPSADTHILIIPKEHIENFMDIDISNAEVASEMVQMAQQLVKELNIENKYKLVINGGEYQFVPHLHMHLLGGEMKGEF